MNAFSNFFVSQNRRDEFPGTIRFVRCGKSTRNKENLCLVNRFAVSLNGFFNVFFRKVFTLDDFRFRTFFLEGFCRIISLIRSLKSRNENFRFCVLRFGFWVLTLYVLQNKIAFVFCLSPFYFVRK